MRSVRGRAVTLLSGCFASLVLRIVGLAVIDRRLELVAFAEFFVAVGRPLPAMVRRLAFARPTPCRDARGGDAGGDGPWIRPTARVPA